MVMTILLGDPRLASVPVHETYQPLVTLGTSFGPARARVRSGIAARLRRAQLALPVGVNLWVVDGHRPAAAQASIIARYSAQIAAAHPDATPEKHAQLVNEFVAPVRLAAHVAGAAVDVTLVDGHGGELDMGTSPDLSDAARERRRMLHRALRDAGLVNYPFKWWHWSFGDRYWALATRAPAALYGGVTDLEAPCEDAA
jgi:D-alanyl-D-alanine dipeptidase